MYKDVARIVRERRIRTLFQPILDCHLGTVLGYEALSRGPAGHRLERPLDLFDAAQRFGSGFELERCCLELAMQRYAATGLEAALFLNIRHDTLMDWGERADALAKLVREQGLDTARIVFELTEETAADDYGALRDAVAALREHGFRLAVDDLGAGYAGLRAWSELSPEFVKLDRFFVSGVHRDAVKMEVVRSILDIARATRSAVIAEGVEDGADADELVALEVDCLQGFLIARPAERPARLADLGYVPRALTTGRNRFENTAGALCIEVPAIAPDMRVEAVAELFRNDFNHSSVAVVEHGCPVGIVRRTNLLDLLSLPLRPELYHRKPVTAVMDANPVVIDHRLRLDQVSRVMTHAMHLELQEDFVVTRNGSYLGLARMIDLLRRVTEMQVHTARHSNPLTLLPGNVPIYDCVNSLLRQQRRFVVCYVDVDNFKPYNDHYGYARGDEVLLQLADALRQSASPRLDFVGHVGGDDFVLVMQSPDWRHRVLAAVDAFESALPRLYAADDLAAGGIEAEDRWGNRRRFSLLSLSVAALEIGTAPEFSAERLAATLAPLKKRAKQCPGSCLIQGVLAGKDVDVLPTATCSVSAPRAGRATA